MFRFGFRRAGSQTPRPPGCYRLIMCVPTKADAKVLERRFRHHIMLSQLRLGASAGLLMYVPGCRKMLATSMDDAAFTAWVERVRAKLRDPL